MTPRTQPAQQPPPVQKLRVRYAKRGRARFASHRDFSRALERAIRRAEIPMAYSSGFSPHPRIAYLNAAPTGAASEAEYVELGLAQWCDPAWVRQVLSDALPQGLDVMAVVEGDGASLSDQLTASSWRIEVPGITPEVMARSVTALLAAPETHVQRMTKNGMRDFDVRPAVLDLQLDSDGSLIFVGLHQSPLVRADDIVQALEVVCGDFRPASTPLLTRLAQGTWQGGSIVEPFS